jgi:hypothetical protein
MSVTFKAKELIELIQEELKKEKVNLTSEKILEGINQSLFECADRFARIEDTEEEVHYGDHTWYGICYYYLNHLQFSHTITFDARKRIGNLIDKKYGIDP